MPIFNLISQRGWGLPSKWRASGRAIIKLSKKKSLVLFTVCLFFCSSESFEKFGLTPEKKTGGKLWESFEKFGLTPEKKTGGKLWVGPPNMNRIMFQCVI
jgi:hypothetical protein